MQMKIQLMALPFTELLDDMRFLTGAIADTIKSLQTECQRLQARINDLEHELKKVKKREK